MGVIYRIAKALIAAPKRRLSHMAVPDAKRNGTMATALCGGAMRAASG
jgi:hypothetical protein